MPASTAALWLVLSLAAIFFLVSYGQELLLANKLTEQSEAQRIANAALGDENTRMQALLHYYQSDKYVEQRAREDLNLRRPDEEVLIPVDPLTTDGQAASPGVNSSAPPAEAAPTPPTELANWQKWFDLFRPGP